MSAISACRSPNQENISEENSSNEKILLYEADTACFSSNNVDKFQEDCYSEKIRLCIDDKNKKFKDTVLNFRNYLENNDLRRIVCYNRIIDKDIETLICESRYITQWLETLYDINYFSFIVYYTDCQNYTIVKNFWCSRETMEAVEMTRFLVKNTKIIGINIIPGLGEGFAPIEEFENPQWHHTPPQMLNTIIVFPLAR